MQRISIRRRLDNGFTVSIQRSEDHYCGKNTYEVAVFDPIGQFDGFAFLDGSVGDDVRGWQTMAEVEALVAHVATFSPNRRGVSALGVRPIEGPGFVVYA